MNPANLLHATSVSIAGRVMLIIGPSGSGKSDLALRLIDRGALLVSDDYTELELRDGALRARAVPTIAGRIEIRGVGISNVAFAAEGPVSLVLDLGREPDRLPADPLPATMLLGVAIPTLPFAPFEASSAIKAEQALSHYGLEDMP